jgi:hypothetical protein
MNLHDWQRDAARKSFDQACLKFEEAGRRVRIEILHTKVRYHGQWAFPVVRVARVSNALNPLNQIMKGD